MDPHSLIDKLPRIMENESLLRENQIGGTFPSSLLLKTARHQSTILDMDGTTEVEGTSPIEPWYIGGPVIKGYGRGSKVLGIPTANLSTEGYSTILSKYPTGVYFGWACLSSRGVYKMVMSVGVNPYFNNTEKTIEPWLLHDFDADFYGEELRLAIVGYIRPEANFPTLESLVERIHEDGKIADKALELPMYMQYKNAPYFTSPLPPNENHQLT